MFELVFFVCLQASDEGGIEVLMEKMRRLTEEAQEELTQEDLIKTFEKVETLSAECKCIVWHITTGLD